jgi:hypothetical protein
MCHTHVLPTHNMLTVDCNSSWLQSPVRMLCMQLAHACGTLDICSRVLQ